MKNIGKVKLTADDFVWIDKEEIFECDEYEIGDEIESSGEIVEEEGHYYKIYTNYGGVDVGYDDIEFINGDSDESV